jgi:nitrogen fixation protein NifU and related proteins
MNVRDLYRESLLLHGRRSSHEGFLEAPALRIPASNPACGDQLELFVLLQGNRVQAIRFQSRSCLIATASASLLCEATQGHSWSEATRVAREFGRIFSDPAFAPPPNRPGWEPLLMLRKESSRAACVRLAWDAFLTLGNETPSR